MTPPPPETSDERRLTFARLEIVRARHVGGEEAERILRRVEDELAALAAERSMLDSKPRSPNYSRQKMRRLFTVACATSARRTLHGSKNTR